MTNKLGGGPMGKNVKQVGVNLGPRSTEKINPVGVAQLGPKVGQRQAVQPVEMGTMNQVPLGNDIAKNVGGGGPGVGRQVTGQSGTQGKH